MFNHRLDVKYDRAGDTLHIWKRKPSRLRSLHGDEPGIVWRIDQETSEIVGAIILNYMFYWHPRIDELALVIAHRFSMPEAEAHDMLDGAIAA